MSFCDVVYILCLSLALRMSVTEASFFHKNQTGSSFFRLLDTHDVNKQSCDKGVRLRVICTMTWWCLWVKSPKQLPELRPWCVKVANQWANGSIWGTGRGQRWLIPCKNTSQRTLLKLTVDSLGDISLFQLNESYLQSALPWRDALPPQHKKNRLQTYSFWLTTFWLRLWKRLIPVWMPDWCALLKAALSLRFFLLPAEQADTDLSSPMLTVAWPVLIFWTPARALAGLEARRQEKKYFKAHRVITSRSLERTQRLHIIVYKAKLEHEGNYLKVGKWWLRVFGCSDWSPRSQDFYLSYTCSWC